LKNESIDTIVANSLLEHLGLEYYSQPPQPTAEQDTMAEFNRILKPHGKLLDRKCLMPRRLLSSIIRASSSTGLIPRKLFAIYEPNFNIIDEAFYARGERCWMEVNREVANKIEQGSGFPVCLCYLEVIKK